MIPASYLYKDVLFSRWDEPRHPAECAPATGRPGGPGLLARALTAAFGGAPSAARTASRRNPAHA